MDGFSFSKHSNFELLIFAEGTYFGFNRLGYFLGTSYVGNLVERVGEKESLIYWVNNDIKTDVQKWLAR